MAIVEVENLVKQFKVYERKKGLLNSLLIRNFKVVNAVNGISFSIKKGETVGFIGPNGAGKSTTIKMLAGILCPTSGSVNVLGFNPFEQREEYAKNMGVVFGQRTQLWWDLPVRESFNLLKHIYNIPEVKFKRKMKKFSEILGLDRLLNIPVRKLSLGQRMRCDLAASLIHNPKIVFLDEPTIGLDIIAKQRIRNFIKDANKKEKTTVILTTHDMRDIEEICKRTIIIDKGKIIYDGSIEEVRKRFSSGKVIVIDFHSKVNKSDIKIKNVSILKSAGKRFWLRVDRSAEISSVVSSIMSNFSVHDITVEEPKIEEIIRNVYRRSS